MKPTRLVVLLLALICVASAAAAAPAGTSAGSKPVTKSAPKTAAPHFTVPFIADDYTKAVAEARARKVPLFIEAWAPW
jgi:hypothetical protein